MSRIAPDQPLVPSVLDRLLDNEPGASRETPRSRHQVLRELKAAVRRDLENLLNTRVRFTTWPAHLTELEKSLVSYGIPDVTAADLGNARNRELFRRKLEDVVRRFEPRFKTVSISLLEPGDWTDRTLRFRIDALLRVEPVPEPVVFDSAVEPTTGDFKIERSA
ncbi:MAG: type VI secretion system baseplate subunit TssE [Thermoguttaceae bacterium]|jgi:type VI secretion system protein ImpF|nr:type VI secretion system baseplate subunit TssE [Thermoguttaceae bacterium]